MTNVELLAWLSAAGAFGVSLIAWWPWFRGHLNHDLFVVMLKKLIAADNVDRARKLCKAAPMAPFVKACDALLTAFVDGKDVSESERVRNIRESFDHTLRDELARASRMAWVSLIAVGLGGVAIYLVVGEGASPYPLALVGMALIAIMHARQIGLRIAIAAGTHRDPLIAALLKSTPPTVN